MRTLLIDDLREIEATRIARTFEEGLKALKEDGPFDILFLDHDLGDEDCRKTGYDILNFLEEHPQYLPKTIKLVTQNPVGLQKMRLLIERLYSKEIA